MKPPRSITQHVYNELRAELISCKLRPGERLGTSELSTRYGVSLSAVREALSRLASESLVVSDPQRGFRASPMSRDDLLDLTETATGIEAMCIRSALATGDKAWEKRVTAARDAVLAAPLTTKSHPNRISNAFAKAHHAFHEALMSACNNARTLQMRQHLVDQSERYRQLCIPLADVSALKDGYREITEAALARDVEKTTSLVSEQFSRNVLRFANALESEGALRFWADEDVRTPARKPAVAA